MSRNKRALCARLSLSACVCRLCVCMFMNVFVSIFIGETIAFLFLTFLFFRVASYACILVNVSRKLFENRYATPNGYTKCWSLCSKICIHVHVLFMCAYNHFCACICIHTVHVRGERRTKDKLYE